MKKFAMFLMALLIALAVGTTNASAQTNLPDPSSIYTALYVPFNTSLTWVIGATAVLMVIRWIKKAVSR